MPTFLPKASTAVILPRPKGSSGAMGIVEDVALPIVEGANQAVRSFAKPVARAMDYFPDQARQATPSSPDNRGMWQMVKDALLEGETQKQRALANARRHAAQLAPFAEKVQKSANEIIGIADDNSSRIRPYLSPAQKAGAEMIGMGPELLLTGPRKSVVLGNRVVSAIKDYGEHQNVPGAVAEALVPKNTVVGNMASNYLTSVLAELRRRTLE